MSKAQQGTSAPSFSDYWKANLAVIPENNGIPIFAWGKIYNNKWRPDDEILLEWDLSDHARALVTGTASNIIAIDLDHVTQEEINRVIDLLGNTLCKKYGSKGITLFYKYNNEKSCNWIKDGIIKAELLSDKRKTTIPPSLHRSVKNVRYIWKEKELLEVYNQLPTLPANYKELLDSLFCINRPVEKEYVRASFDFKPTHAQAVEALSFCNSNCSNDEWIQIGLSFKSEVGDAGFQDFDSWSSGGKSYDRNSIRNRWRSFNGHSITYGTLIHFAKQGGYLPPQREALKPTIAISVDEMTAKKLERYANDIKESEKLPDFYVNAPYHVKLICDWIVSTSRYPQPIITMGAVLSFLGFWMNDFKFKGIKGNIYNINLGRTTQGKEHIFSCIRGLMYALEMGKLVGGSGATSDTAILELIKENEGKTFYLIDEFHTFLKVLSNKKSGNAREAALIGVLLKAYTSRIISGVDYADRKERKTVVVKNPFVSLCTFSVPEPFYEALGSAEAFNGLVGRLAVFEAAKILPKRNKNHNPEAELQVPQEIIEILKNIKSNRKKGYNADGSFYYEEFSEINCLSEVSDLLENLNDEIDDKRREYDKEDNQMSNVIGRIFEMIKKYLIIGSQGKEILMEHISWAKSLADYNVGNLLQAAQNIADTDYERKKNHVLDFIKKKGGTISKTDFSNNCKIFDNRREKEDVIRDLLEAGRLEVIELTGSTKSRTGYKLVAS